MRTHVALLRGINVGGHNKVAMGELRDLVASLGHREVISYINSGNVLFAACEPGEEAGAIADALGAAVAERLGVAAAVVVVSRAELGEVVLHNPFPEETNPKAVHAVIFREAAGPEREAAVAAALARAHDAGSRDDARVAGRTVYMWTPDGLGRSKLAVELARGRDAPASQGTARNWATVTKLLSLFDA